MNIGRVLGTVVCSTKNPGLIGHKLYLFEPIDENLNSIGPAQVAVDTVGSRENDIISYVTSREAALAMRPWFVPVDAAIVGIIDHFNEITL